MLQVELRISNTLQRKRQS